MKYTILLVLSIFVLSESAINTDSVTLTKDNGIIFSSKAIMPYTITDKPLSCSTSMVSDFFFRTIREGTCTWVCRQYQFGMFNTFYRSKKQMSEYNLDNLNLNDTAMFSKIVGAQCTLPYYELSSGMGTASFFVGLSQGDKYVLFTISPKMIQGYKGEAPPVPYYYYNDIKLKWWLQTDGTLSFSGVTKALPRVSGTPIKMKAAGTTGTYNIFGQRVSSKRTGSQILIQGKRLVFKNGR